MRDLMEGSRAVAETVAACRPAVVPAYPITPQTHIVEHLGTLVRDGRLADCRYLTVESEFAAMSAAVGAAACGARAYTATASQGLLYMAEVLYNASGLGLPIVMTVANRAIGAPINIWNDHSDVMSQRDCGWVQLHAADNQHAVDLHVLAFRLAEHLSVPVMVCMDGFVLTHAFEPIDVPAQDLVDSFLPPLRPRQQLDPQAPLTIGAMVGPDAYTEVRYLAHHRLGGAGVALEAFAQQWQRSTGRTVPLLHRQLAPGARIAVVALGSATGTAATAAATWREPVEVFGLTVFRPFPVTAVRDQLRHFDHVVALERAFAPGAGGVLAADLRTALAGTATRVHAVVAGLGGRPVTVDTVHRVLDHVRDNPEPELDEPLFADLRRDLVDAELAQEPVVPA